MRWRIGAAGLFAVVAAVASFTSCRQVVGITDNPPARAGTSACGLPLETTTCASCVAAKCCAESTQCAADSTFCGPYESCLAGCKGEPACRSKCTDERPVPAANAAPVSALSACLAKNCETECGLTCGGFSAFLSEPDAAAGCQTCLEKNACASVSACATSVECNATWRCIRACTKWDCESACIGASDAGTALLHGLYQDFSATCAADCNYGGDWSCAGSFHAWPPSQSAAVSLTWWVYDFSSQMGVPGADVSVCASCPCPIANTPVLAHAQTDDAGYFTVSVPQTVDPANQPQSLCVVATAPGYMTTYTYFTAPISEPSASIRNQLLPGVSAGTILLTASAQMLNEQGFGVAYDPSRGVVGVGVWDCLGNPANGVSIALSGGDSMVVALAGLDGGPGSLPTSATGAAGLGTGRAIFLNVPQGSVTLTATPPGFTVPVDTRKVSVGAGILTQVGMTTFPSP